MRVTDGEKGHIDLVKYAPLHEPGEIGHDCGVFVFPSTVVQLQEECPGELATALCLQAFYSPLDDLDGEVGIVSYIFWGMVGGGRGLPVDHSHNQMVPKTDRRVVLGELRKMRQTVAHVLTPGVYKRETNT